jgi:hypothetical protein
MVTEEGLLMAVGRLRTLTHLDVHECEVTDAVLSAVSSSQPVLTHLDIRGCCQVTDDGLQPLRRLAELSLLNLNDCEQITAVGVQALLGGTAASGLRVLHSEWPVEQPVASAPVEQP